MNSAEPASTAPTGQPSPLLKSTHTGIEGSGVAGGIHARLDDRVEKPRAVHVQQQPVRPGRLAHRLDGLQRPDRAAALIRGLLDNGEARAWRIAAHCADRIGKLLRRIDAGLAVERAHHGAGERRRAAALRRDDVRGAVADHLLAGAAVHQQCDLVAHGAGREEDSRLLAQHRGHARLQRIDGGVLAALFVADLGLGHGLAHGRRRPRDRVAPEIDVIARHAALPFVSVRSLWPAGACSHKLWVSHKGERTEMTAIDPNNVHFTGENSFLRLKTDPEGEETTVCAHWRTLISPAGPGTCLFLRSDATGGEVKLYADNIGMARWLQGELEAILNPPFADAAMPIMEAAFSHDGAFRSTYREIVDSAEGRIELTWSDMGEPFMLTLPPNNDDTGPWAVYSCLTPCRTATLEVAGTRAQGAAYENVMFGRPASSCCLAWSETWLRS